MSKRSPHRVEQLYFLLRREPTVRMAENLERRCYLSIKNKKPKLLHLFCLCTFFCFPFEKKTIWLFVSFSLTIPLISLLSHFVLILTLCTISTINFHHLSTHATCVTWVHVVGNSCHFTCLSNPFYGTRHGALKNVKFRLSRNSTKFDMVARFHETIPTVKSVSSSEI